MAGCTKIVFLFLNCVVLYNFVNSELTNMIDEDVLTTKAYVFWPNATLPFYIDNEHFDHEQSIAIMTALSLFAFKTCLKFAPVMARPGPMDHVLVLENPTGVRKCTISTDPHSIEEPHRVTLGYDCLKSPEIDMMIMKALGFPFEHNRAVRDLYIEVQPENVEPGYLELFTRDLRLPMELRAIPYDPNSVMHFGEREFSKNGHRTIIFKNRYLRQERFGLSPLDLRKIDVVYGPECRKRDRQEKIELCQNYPGVARKKRDTTDVPRSLRVNPEITPPPSIVKNGTEGNITDKVAYANAIVKELGIEKEVDEIIEQVHKVGSVAFAKSKDKLCNNETKDALRTIAAGFEKPNNKSLLEIIGDITEYANSLVMRATQNLTEFCLETSSIYDYQRSCPFYDTDRCPKHYRSTKSGVPRYSTQHRPIIEQSTQPQHTPKRNIYENWLRTGNKTGSDATDGVTTPTSVSKSDVVAGKGLRSGTRLPSHNKQDQYAPLYRSSDNSAKNESSLKPERKKREVPKEKTTVVVKISTSKKDESKKLKKSKKAGLKSKSAKRRFEHQRFRAKKEQLKNGDYERGQKEREWDNSGLSQEKHSYKDQQRPPSHVGVKVKERMKRPYVDSAERYSEEQSPRHDVQKPGYGKKNAEEAERFTEGNMNTNRYKKRPHQPRSGEDYREEKREGKRGRGKEQASNEKYYHEQNTEGRVKNSYENYENYHQETKDKSGEKDYQNIRGNRGSSLKNEEREQNLKPSGVGSKIREKEDVGGIKDTRGPDATELERDVQRPKPKVSEEDLQPGKFVSKELEKKPVIKMRLVKKNSSKSKSRNQEENIGEINIKQNPYIDEVKSKSKPTTPKTHEQTPSERAQPISVLPRVVELSKENREFYEERKWPDGVVRYVIKDPGGIDIDDVRFRLSEVNQILKRRTCTQLEELTEEQAENYEDYLVLDNSPDYVTGRVGGRQPFGVVELLKGGQHRQHAAMMVMAMLGFYFEISRHDRDQYIRVHMRHVRPDKLHHFEKVREDATFPLPYDYKSATHPAWQFWRQLGKSGISTVATFKHKDPDGSVMKSLGQNSQLMSELDIVKINTVYGIDCFMKSKHKKGSEEVDEEGLIEKEGEKEKEDEDEKGKEGDDDISNKEEDEI